MALPPALQSSTTPYELEFTAMEDIVEIVPLFSMDRIRLLSGIFGPFRPPTKAKIPMWMAANLKSRRKCHIVPPDWLSPEHLQECLKVETTSEGFSALPFRFAEISKVLLDMAADDLDSPEKIRSLLKDIREARQAKSREGLRMLNHNNLRMRNMCAMEINEIRPFFIKSMGILTKLAPAVQAGLGADDTFETMTTAQQSFSNMDESMDSEW
ncbi:DNA replication protein psf2 [Tulasnella sp. JGI-2019a]|nr:DNA replication protein psf2 [Tulasnella sp. JGI-2019a]KAG8993586.1 DNA replication protein psf2 [Tulasnella sp. JGI-2019a]KAG9025245.1 DNA replication protein psf2 [Tulasnella sp. JGI-2019a]